MRKKDNFAGTLPGTGKSLVAFPETYVVLDLETTGLDPERDQIIEIGALEVVRGKRGRTFSTLIQPRTPLSGHYVSPFITQLTGITDDMLAAAPQPRQALEAFGKFLGSRVAVGYNVGFDMGFLQQQFQTQLYRPLANDWVDVLPMAQTLFPLWDHHRLNNLAAWYKVENKEAHRALSDVETTETCFRKLKEDAALQYPSLEAFLEKVRQKMEGKNEGQQLSLW